MLGHFNIAMYSNFTADPQTAYGAERAAAPQSTFGPFSVSAFGPKSRVRQVVEKGLSRSRITQNKNDLH